MNTQPCRTCGQTVPVLDYCASLAAAHGVVCESCIGQSNHQDLATEVMVARLRSFQRMCPPCFADTDTAKLPCQKKSEAALRWSFGGTGLNLWGWPGTGKSRTMSLIVKDAVARGRTVIAFGPGSFRAHCECYSWRRSGWLKHLATVDLLFLDDFDKMNLTREMERDLFAMLNERMGRRPTLVTGNTRGADLEHRFSLGVPLVDRLRRYCTSIHFGKEDIR